MNRKYSQANNTSNTKKHEESVLRHKVRNLRAKVKCLVPIDICKKYTKRNKELRDIFDRK